MKIELYIEYIAVFVYVCVKEKERARETEGDSCDIICLVYINITNIHLDFVELNIDYITINMRINCQWVW